jgi:hypothetical protein
MYCPKVKKPFWRCNGGSFETGGLHGQVRTLNARHRHKRHVLTVAWDYCPDHCPEQMDLRGVSDAEEESNCLDLLRLLSSGELT